MSIAWACVIAALTVVACSVVVDVALTSDASKILVARMRLFSVVPVLAAMLAITWPSQAPPMRTFALSTLPTLERTEASTATDPA